MRQRGQVGGKFSKTEVQEKSSQKKGVYVRRGDFNGKKLSFLSPEHGQEKGRPVIGARGVGAKKRRNRNATEERASE